MKGITMAKLSLWRAGHPMIGRCLGDCLPVGRQASPEDICRDCNDHGLHFDAPTPRLLDIASGQVKLRVTPFDSSTSLGTGSAQGDKFWLSNPPIFPCGKTTSLNLREELFIITV